MAPKKDSDLRTLMEGVTLSSLESQLGVEVDSRLDTAETEIDDSAEPISLESDTMSHTVREGEVRQQVTAPAVPSLKLVSRAGVFERLWKSERRFGPFTLLGVIGRGGMAEVRLAFEELPEGHRRPCVVKYVRREHDTDEEVRAMFLEEAKISPLLNHPNVVRTYGTGSIEGVPYIALELIDGITSKDLLEYASKRPLPLFVPIEIGLCVARALHYAHNLKSPEGAPLGLVHRDVTPQNILISTMGRVKLVDFGIALYDGRVFQTQDGITRGKVTYMSPEQISEGICSPKSDIFALGVVLTELVSGEKLITNRTLGVLAIDDLEELVRSRLRRHKEMTPAIESLLVRLCAKKESDRPADALAIARELEELLGDTPSLRLPRWVRLEIFGHELDGKDLEPKRIVSSEEVTLDEGAPNTDLRLALAAKAGERAKEVTASSTGESWPPEPVTEPAYQASRRRSR